MVASVGYAPFFVCLGLFDVAGAVILWTLVRERGAAAETAL
jgi:ACS family hexuronate transporter-like MFS transporter